MGEDDKVIRLVDTHEGGKKFGYQPKATPKPEERGYKPATGLDTSKPPQGKGGGQKSEAKK